MPKTIYARLPPRVEQKLREYCARNGVTRFEALVQALGRYLDGAGGGSSACSLAADLIPRRGAKSIRSDNVRELARRAFGGSRVR